MARKTPNRKKTRNAAGGASQNSAPQNKGRRHMMTRLAAYGVGGAAVIGGGAVFAMDFRSKLVEQDLSAIGQGTPVILQIHDPQCDLCAQLQRETRRALRSFSEEAVLYRVANIRTQDGAEIQRREGLPHVTLALFDGAGQRQHVITGVTPADELITAFRRHLSLTLV